MAEVESPAKVLSGSDDTKKKNKNKVEEIEMKTKGEKEEEEKGKKSKKEKKKKEKSFEAFVSNLEKKVVEEEIKQSEKKQKEEEKREEKKEEGNEEFKRQKEHENYEPAYSRNFKSFDEINYDFWSKPSKDVEKFAHAGDVESLKHKGKTAAKESNAILHAAWAKNDLGLEAIKHLLTVDVSVNHRDHYGFTPLHLAAIRGNAKVVSYLLEDTRIMVRPYDGNHRTPLMYAIMYQNNEIVKILSQKENVACDAKERPRLDRRGNTALHVAIEYKNDEAISMVINEGNCNKENENGDTPLMLCSRLNNFVAMNMIVGKVQKKKWVPLSEFLGKTDAGKISALHIAANNGAYHCVKIFMKHKDAVNFEEETSKGITPLAFAVGSNSIETAKAILDVIKQSRDEVKKAIQYSKLVKKTSPWKIATIKKVNPEMTQLLLDYGADVNDKVDDGTALYQTLREVKKKLPHKKQQLDEILNLLDFAFLLLSNKADLTEKPDYDDETAFDILKKGLAPLRIEESTLRDYPMSAITKWKKFIILS